MKTSREGITVRVGNSMFSTAKQVDELGNYVAVSMFSRISKVTAIAKACLYTTV